MKPLIPPVAAERHGMFGSTSASGTTHPRQTPQVNRLPRGGREAGEIPSEANAAIDSRFQRLHYRLAYRPRWARSDLDSVTKTNRHIC